MGCCNGKKTLRENVRMLERKLGLLNNSEMACCGVTMAQCHAIVEIGRSTGISLQALASLLNLDNSTMSRTVDNLVKNGLVKRESDPSDRRYIEITLTPQGDKVFKGIEGNMNMKFSKIYENIPLEKRNEVIECIQYLVDAFEK